jgi:hypothetical protein
VIFHIGRLPLVFSIVSMSFLPVHYKTISMVNARTFSAPHFKDWDGALIVENWNLRHLNDSMNSMNSHRVTRLARRSVAEIEIALGGNYGLQPRNRTVYVGSPRLETTNNRQCVKMLLNHSIYSQKGDFSILHVGQRLSTSRLAEWLMQHGHSGRTGMA